VVPAAHYTGEGGRRLRRAHQRGPAYTRWAEGRCSGPARSQTARTSNSLTSCLVFSEAARPDSGASRLCKCRAVPNGTQSRVADAE